MKSNAIIYFIITISILSPTLSAFGDNSIYNDSDQKSTLNNDIEPDGSIPYKNTGLKIQKTIVRGMLFLIFIAVVAVILVSVYKKRVHLYNDIATKKRIRLIEAKRLSREAVVFLVGVDDKEYLLSQIGDAGSIERVDPDVNNNKRIS